LEINRVFEIMKDQIAFSSTLGYFKRGAKIVVVADASPAGFANIVHTGSR
jgi:hypothetical protein